MGYVPQWLAVPMANDRNVREPVANFERKLVKVEVWVEEVALVLASSFKRKVFSALLVEKVLLSRSRLVRHSQVFSDLNSIPIRTFSVDDSLALYLAFYRLFRIALATDSQHVDATQQRTIQIRLICVNIPVQPWIDPPLDNTKRLIKQWRQTVANRVVKVIAKDQLVATDIRLGCERKGYRVPIIRVFGGREVG